MGKLSKRYQASFKKVDREKYYPLAEALQLVRDCASAKFDETIDIYINLGIDPTKSDQSVRGAVVLPNGNGKKVRVAVFAQGAAAEAAAAAGADKVGFEDLAQAMKDGDLNYDVVIASPDAMRIVGQLGQVLGPRGLMPNPKVGTVSPDVAGAVRNAKGGQVRYRADKAGILHCTIGKASFAVNQLEENLKALMQEVKKAKPAGVKGIFLRKITVSSTMGPGVHIDLATTV